jgi:hypothetical protein
VLTCADFRNFFLIQKFINDIVIVRIVHIHIIVPRARPQCEVRMVPSF